MRVRTFSTWLSLEEAGAFLTLPGTITYSRTQTPFLMTPLSLTGIHRQLMDPHDTLPLVLHPPALHPLAISRRRPAKSSLILLVLGWFSGVEKQRHFRSSRDRRIYVEGGSHVLVSCNLRCTVGNKS